MNNKNLFGIIIVVALLLVAFISWRIHNSPPTKESPQFTNTNGLDQVSMSKTPSCPQNLTPTQTSRPYYKTGSPEKNSLIEIGPRGAKLTLSGFVLDQDCQPIANTWLDFWQADANGEYDNVGYNLRGHQFADKNGKYTLETIMPLKYGTRPAHIHVKIRPPNRPITTTQLYFPGESQNQSDSIYNSELLVDFSESKQHASFDFKIKN